MKTHRVLLVQGFRYALSGIKLFYRDAKTLTREASLKLKRGQLFKIDIQRCF